VNKIDWSQSHCGVMLCTIEKTIELMPEVQSMLMLLLPHLEHDAKDYLVDVKVHMLMPNEYPCIPNWHRDFVPRDKNLNQLPEKITGDLMYIHVSGAPYTQFKTDQGTIATSEALWTVITQNDFHRGIKSEIHTWRAFIRLIPKWFVHPATVNVGKLRRHSQVYIDEPDQFRW
jgi:hypothetical protein